MLNSDDTASCDRCGRSLPGYGVLHGMVVSHLDGPSVEGFIVCYDCRSLVLDGFVNHADVDSCTRCGRATRHAVAVALLATDVDPDVPSVTRQMRFCYTECAPILLDRLSLV